MHIKERTLEVRKWISRIAAVWMGALRLNIAALHGLHPWAQMKAANHKSAQRETHLFNIPKLKGVKSFNFFYNKLFKQINFNRKLYQLLKLVLGTAEDWYWYYEHHLIRWILLAFQCHKYNNSNVLGTLVFLSSFRSTTNLPLALTFWLFLILGTDCIINTINMRESQLI